MNSIKSILLRYYHRETKWVVVTNCIIIVLFGAMCSWLYFSQHECIDIAWAECPCMMKINGSWAYNMSFWNPNPNVFDITLNKTPMQPKIAKIETNATVDKIISCKYEVLAIHNGVQIMSAYPVCKPL